MTTRWIIAFACPLALSVTARAGGLLLPGAGVVSASRAGAAIASADDAEAIVLNPAGIAKSHGTVITLGVDAISYGLAFQRAGNYPMISEEATNYAGTRFPKMTNMAKPPLGLGSYQPVPLLGIVSDLGGVVPGLHIGFAVYAPNAYPFRNFNTVNGQPFFAKDPSTGAYTFPSSFGGAPPPTRYDVVEQEATIILPTIAAAYSIPRINLDIGARFSAGWANLKSTSAVWALPNYEEFVKQDSLVTIDASDKFVTTYGFGATYRPLPHLELAAQWSAPIDIHASGNAYSSNGPNVMLGPGMPVTIGPVPDASAVCAKGGTPQALKACIDIVLPMTATIGGRWKFTDRAGHMRGDIELNVGWQHWGARCDYATTGSALPANCNDPSNYQVTIDGQATTSLGTLPLKPQLLEHGLQDTYAVRLGGSWIIPIPNRDEVVVRAGVGYETAPAEAGWERVDFDGAAQTTFAFGASYKFPRVSIDAGFGYIYEGTRTQNRGCMPTSAAMGCGPNGAVETYPNQVGAQPVSPVSAFNGQADYPVNEGTFNSHYIYLMLGASTWF